MKGFTKQRLSYDEKVANEFDWCKKTIDHLLINYSYAVTAVNRNSTDYLRMLSNYQLYNNQLNQADFERECNPLGLEIGQFKDAIQPYNKTYNKIQVLLGEELRRPFNYRVIMVNSDGIKSKLQYRDQLIREYVMAKIQEAIGDTPPEESPMDPAQVNEYFRTTYLDAREILSSKLLKYLEKKLDVLTLKNESFKHALLSGYEFVYVGDEGDEPTLTLLNPLGVFYHKAPETMYLQDGLFAGYRTYMTSADVIDRFGDYLSDDQKAQIDERYTVGQHDFKTMQYPKDPMYEAQMTSNVIGSYGNTSYPNTDWLVQHVEWRSFRKVGFLSYINEFGDETTDVVSEDFVLPKDHEKSIITKEYGKKCTYYTWTSIDGVLNKLEWDWIPEIWSGVKIGTDIYCMMGPKKHQFRSMDDPYDVKLGYHGIVYSSMNAAPISLMDRMKPFQYLYFIVMHKLKKLIAQDAGKVFKFDLSMVDPSFGVEKTLYYLKEMNIDIYNSLQNADQPGWAQRGKSEGSTDWSNVQYIVNYISILAAIDQQISDVAGVTRQREGQMSPNEAVANAQSAVQMSSLVTEIYFNTHFKFWEKVLTSLLNITQSIYKGDKAIKQFILDDMSLATLEMTPDGLRDIDVGVFLTFSGREADTFESLRALGADMLRANRATFSDMVNLFHATSVAELKTQVRSSEEETAQKEQQMQQMQQQTMMQIEELKHAKEMEIAQLEADTKIKVAEIQSFSRQMDQDINDNQVPDQLEVEKLRSNIQLKNRELDIKEEELSIKKKAIESKSKESSK